jgi:phage tail-like protein
LRYPGETVTLFTRVDVLQAVPGLALRISLPDDFTLDHYRASPNHGGGVPDLLVWEGKRYLAWRLDQRRELQPGERFEYQLCATIAPIQEDVTLDSRAVAMPLDPQGLQDPSGLAGDTASIIVSARGRYLKYLPAVYAEQDEFMGRLVMLFESFWAPIQQQVAQIHYYFDPRLMPADLLPWMASWSDLALSEQWPEDRRRKLVRSAIRLFRMRGTPRGLLEFLEIYAGVTPQIVEHRATNFRLGQGARLGASVALGTRNKPYAFTVSLRLPPVQAADEIERARLETERRRAIEAIIEAEKPAHTVYTLDIEET